MRHFPEVRRVRSPLAGAALALACALAPGVPATPATAQTVDTDSLREARRQQVEAYAARVDRAAGVFLDADRPDGERLEAVEGIAVFNRSEHLRRAAEIVLDSAEEVAIRARALRLAGHAADSDTAFLRGMFALALDGGTPPRLRRGMSELFQSLMFASASKLLLREEFHRTLRRLARDPDRGVRRPALQVMASVGDSATLQMLADVVRGEAQVGVEVAEAVRLLGLRDPEPWYPLLRDIVADPPDPGARIEAIRLLGGDRESRSGLIDVLRSPEETLAARRAALGALAAGGAEMARVALPVVAGEGNPTELRLQAIMTVEQRRISRDRGAIEARGRDDFDALMERLREEADDPRVRRAAERYLERTRRPR